jgi:hypothetical protein
MEARLVRDELVKCQRAEGVNHYQSCKELAEKYTGMIRENKVRLFFWCDWLAHEVADLPTGGSRYTGQGLQGH